LQTPYVNGNPTKGGDQQEVVAAMVDFMMIYQLWANNPHGRFTTYNIGAGTSHDAIYSYLQSSASTLGLAAGTGKVPGGISGLLYY
jgi:hypothetical protein